MQAELSKEGNEVITLLTKALVCRHAFLEEVLRTKRVGETPLDELRADKGQDWPNNLLAAIATYVKTPPEPVAKYIEVAVRRYRPERLVPSEEGQDDESARRARAWENEAPRMMIGERLRWSVESFIGQHLLCYFPAKAFKDKGGQFADVGEWRRWLLAEVLSFYDATVIEILSERQISGMAALDAYEESLAKARNKRHVDDAGETIWDEKEQADFDDFETQLPARRKLVGALVNAPPEKRSEILWRFIGNVDGIIRGVRAVLFDDSRKLSWLNNLLKCALEELKRSSSYKEKINPVDGGLKKLGVYIVPRVADWLLEPERLSDIAEAAQFVMDLAKVPLHTSAEGDGDGKLRIHQEDARHADVLEVTQRRLFVQGARLVRAGERRANRRGTAPGNEQDWERDPRLLFENVSLVRVTSILEHMWWSSFDQVPQTDWEAKKIAAFCAGARRAVWSNPGSRPDGVDADKRILDVTTKHGERTQTGNERAGKGRAKIKAAVQSGDDALRVVVFGAGIAGLTAAHELAERGFEVVVIESTKASKLHPREDPKDPSKLVDVDIGGMARTQWAMASQRGVLGKLPKRAVAGGDGGSEGPFPGEHGYRLFPSFYRHVFDTMKRTPILLDGNVVKGVHPTAFDQLQPTHRQVFARRSQFVPLSRDKPRSLEAFRKEYMYLHEGLGFAKRDMARFFFKLLRYLMTCSERRAAEYEGMTLLQFFGPDLYSPNFLQMIKAAPQALVAMDAAHCDARTQGNVYLQLLLDQVLGGPYTDSTLRGPTSTAWLEHWYDYLRKLGVQFVNAELLSFDAEDKPGTEEPEFHIVLQVGPEVPAKAVTLDDAGKTTLEDWIKHADYYVMALDAVSAERVTRGWEWPGVPTELRGFASNVAARLEGRLDRHEVAVTFSRPKKRTDAEDVLRFLLGQALAAKDDQRGDPVLRSAFRSLTRATGSVEPGLAIVDEVRLNLWFQRKVGDDEVRLIELALAQWLDADQDARVVGHQWVEQPMTVTTPRLPDDMYGEGPEDRFQTFTGIQYYFKQDFKLVRGHVYFPDTEWGLSAISQSQIWLRSELPGDVRGVLSVDIGDCTRKSSYNHKSLMECSPREIADEVWRQIQDSLRTSRGPTSVVTSLPLPEPLYYHLDENLIFTSEGGALRTNLTPFLINNVGDWEKRPKCIPWVPGRPVVADAPRTDATDVWQSSHGGYRVHAGRVVFCGTYMRTFTRMSTMEAANESARHAVNAILDHLAEHPTRAAHAGYQAVAGDYCDIWDIEEQELEDLEFFKRVDKMLFEAGKPHIADILQFDKVADLQHPDPTPAQALIAALGGTLGADWGVKPNEAVASFNGVMEIAKSIAGELGGAYGGGEAPMQKLLTLLGIAKGGPARKAP